jgi:hypothetical protein
MRQKAHGSKLTTRRRNSRGAQLAEFGPALALLVGIIIVPLLDLSLLPIRWILAQNLVNDYSRQLSLCETFSQSMRRLNAFPSLSSRLRDLGGISADTIDMHLKVSRIYQSGGAGNQADLNISTPGTIPDVWLPNGANAPCSYSLEIQINSLMSPAFLFPKCGVDIPGLTAPVPLLLTASHNWENLGRDPRTHSYFLNE